MVWLEVTVVTLLFITWEARERANIGWRKLDFLEVNRVLAMT